MEKWFKRRKSTFPAIIAVQYWIPRENSWFTEQKEWNGEHRRSDKRHEKVLKRNNNNKDRKDSGEQQWLRHSSDSEKCKSSRILRHGTSRVQVRLRGGGEGSIERTSPPGALGVGVPIICPLCTSSC